MTNLPRRSFLRLGAGVLAAAELPRAAWAKRAPLAPLELKTIEIAAGASKPFGAVHVSDTHIVRADKRVTPARSPSPRTARSPRGASTTSTRRSTPPRPRAKCSSTPATSSTS